MAFKRKKTGKKKVPLLAITGLIAAGLMYAYSRDNQKNNSNKKTEDKKLPPNNDFVPGNEMEYSEYREVENSVQPTRYDPYNIINLPSGGTDDTVDDTGHIVDDKGVGIMRIKL